MNVPDASPGSLAAKDSFLHQLFEVTGRRLTDSSRGFAVLAIGHARIASRSLANSLCTLLTKIIRDIEILPIQITTPSLLWATGRKCPALDS
jgi:hypothetical protein